MDTEKSPGLGIQAPGPFRGTASGKDPAHRTPPSCSCSLQPWGPSAAGDSLLQVPLGWEA